MRRYREVTAEETESLRELGYPDAEIWRALGYRSEWGWRLALQRYDKLGPHRKPGPKKQERTHGTYRSAVIDQCRCDKCATELRKIYDRANERKRADRAELRARRERDTP